MKRTILAFIIVCLAASMIGTGCNGRDEADFNGAISPIACETADEAARLFLEEEYSNEYETLEFVSYSKTADLGNKEIEDLELGDYSAADVKSGERGEVTYREVKVNSTAAVAQNEEATLGKEIYILSMTDGLHYYTPAVKVGEKVPYSMILKLYQESRRSKFLSVQMVIKDNEGPDEIISVKRSGDRLDIIGFSQCERILAFKAGGKCYSAYYSDGAWEYMEDEFEYAYNFVSGGANIEDIDVSDETKEKMKFWDDANVSSVYKDRCVYESKDTIVFNYSHYIGTQTDPIPAIDTEVITISGGRIVKTVSERNTGDGYWEKEETTYSYKNVKIDLPNELKKLLKKDGINV